MRLSYIIFSFILSASYVFASEWKTFSRDLISDRAKEVEARKKLQAIKDLDKELAEALEKGGMDEKLALVAIRKLPHLSMVDVLLNKIEKMDVHEPETESYIVTLLSMVETSKGNEILDKVSKKVDLTSARISSALRISLLSAMSIKGRLPSVSTLTELLEDPSFDMRLKALEVASEEVEKSPKTYETFLKKALSVSPYPVRLKALEEIEKMPKTGRLTYKDIIEKCSKEDQNDVVKETCRNIQF